MWSDIFKAVIPSVINWFSAKNTNDEQVEQADKQTAFQQEMSNTAHTREVADLRNAGLNPILSAKFGGASTPTGFMAQLRNPAEHIATDYSSAGHVNLQAQMNKELIATQRTQQALNTATAAKAQADTLTSLEQSKQAKMDTAVKQKVLPSKMQGEGGRYWVDWIKNLNPFHSSNFSTHR